jgi:hypothetical protein
MERPNETDPTGLHLRMIANKRRLLPPTPKGAHDSRCNSRPEDKSSYHSALTDVLAREYRGVYIHPVLVSLIVDAIDGLVRRHLTDMVVRETIDLCVEGAIQEATAKTPSFQW